MDKKARLRDREFRGGVDRQDSSRSLLSEKDISDGSVPPTEACRVREKSLEAINWLLASPLVVGPHAKFVVLKKPKKGRRRNNGVYPTHVGSRHSQPEDQIPERMWVVGTMWNKNPILTDKEKWGDDKPYEDATVSRRRGQEAKMSSSKGSSAPRKLDSKEDMRIKEFFKSLDGPMSDSWPLPIELAITANVFMAMADDCPLKLRTPTIPMGEESSLTMRTSFLLSPNDLPLRNFEVHFILAEDRHHHLNFATSFTLLSECTATGLQAEADLYNGHTREGYDRSRALMLVTRTGFNNWEIMPLSVIKRRQVKVLYDWVYTGSYGYWSLPLRVALYNTNEDNIHPGYHRSNQVNLLAMHPPCKTADPSGLQLAPVESMAVAQEEDPTEWGGDEET